MNQPIKIILISHMWVTSLVLLAMIMTARQTNWITCSNFNAIGEGMIELIYLFFIATSGLLVIIYEFKNYSSPK